MKNKNSKNYAWLFGGGAIRGAGHVGVLYALEELDIIPTTLCGSSVGSIIAALYAVGFTKEELADIFLHVNFELFRDISFGFSQKFALSKGEVFLDWIRELIEKKFYKDNYVKGDSPHICFKDINRNLVIITTNMNDFSCNEFSTFATPDFEIAMAVRISCCMPGLMRAVNMNDKLLVDGDLMKGKPMWSLTDNLKNSPDRILEIRLEGTFSGTDQNAVEYVNGMYSCMTFSETEFIKKTYCCYDKYDYLVINTGNVVVVDFNYPEQKRQEIIDSGYLQTIKYFTIDLVDKKKRLCEIYTKVLYAIQKTKNFMKSKKYFQAKCNIANLFVEIIDDHKFIDEEFYNKLKDIQILMFRSIKNGLLGRSVCTCKTEIIDELENLIIENIEIINDLNDYINKYANKCYKGTTELTPAKSV